PGPSSPGPSQIPQNPSAVESPSIRCIAENGNSSGRLPLRSCVALRSCTRHQRPFRSGRRCSYGAHRPDGPSCRVGGADVKSGRRAFDPPPSLVEVVRMGDGFVLLVGRASILLERADAEAVVVSLTGALSRISVDYDAPDRSRPRN